CEPSALSTGSSRETFGASSKRWSRCRIGGCDLRMHDTDGGTRSISDTRRGIRKDGRSSIPRGIGGCSEDGGRRRHLHGLSRRCASVEGRGAQGGPAGLGASGAPQVGPSPMWEIVDTGGAPAIWTQEQLVEGLLRRS